MPEFKAERRVREIATSAARAADQDALQQIAAFEATVAEQAEMIARQAATIATLEAKVAQHDTKIDELDGKVAAAEAKP